MLKLFFLNLKTTFFRLFEWGRVVFRYYSRSPSFLWLDLLLFSQYFWKNPHHISRDFAITTGSKELYVFGETPLTTLDKIASQCRILSEDTVFELGCGSARTCFWLRTFIQCQVVGVDYLPAFIQKGKKVKKWSGLSGIDFLEQDMLQVDLRKASIIYLYGTCLSDHMIDALTEKFKQLASKTRIITVSYPLEGPDFAVIKQFTARFPWGKAEVFLNEKL